MNKLYMLKGMKNVCKSLFCACNEEEKNANALELSAIMFMEKITT